MLTDVPDLAGDEIRREDLVVQGLLTDPRGRGRATLAGGVE